MDELLHIADSLGIPLSLVVFAGTLWVQARAQAKHVCELMQKTEGHLARFVTSVEDSMESGIRVHVIPEAPKEPVRVTNTDSGAFYLGPNPLDPP